MSEQQRHLENNILNVKDFYAVCMEQFNPITLPLNMF